MFVYQPTFDTLDLKKDRDTDYLLSWKSKGVYTSKFKPLYTAFFHSIKFSRHKVGIIFDKDPLVIDQNNYTTKKVNVSIVFDLDTWPKILRNNFKLKNCLFGATTIVKNSDKEK